MRKTVLSYLLLLSFFSSAQKLPVFVTDSLDGYAARIMKQWELPGMAIAIVKNGKVVLAKGYGVRELGREEKVDDQTLFMIASCSKAFTATAIGLLGEEHKLSLDEPVTKWLQEFSLYDTLAAKEATVRDLLCHRLGLGTFQGDFVHWNSNLSRKEIIAQLGRYEPPFGFRAGFGYCNAAFTAAGEIIPAATDGMTWENYLQRRFFDPLHMERTYASVHALFANGENAARGHTRWEGQEKVIAYDNVDNLGGAAAINSCVSDLARWIQLQLDSGRYEGKQVVPFSVLEETRAPQMMMESTSSSFFPSTHFKAYGLGWFLRDYAGKKIIWHDGGTGGFLSNVTLVPEENLGFVILTNSDNNGIFEALHHQLLDAFLGMPYRDYSSIYFKEQAAYVKKQELDLKKSRDLVAQKKKPPVPLEAFNGIYENKLYGRVTITAQNGVLVMTMQHHPKVGALLEYREGNTLLCTYKSPVFGVRVTPFRLDGKEVHAITLSANAYLDFGDYEFVKLR